MTLVVSGFLFLGPFWPTQSKNAPRSALSSQPWLGWSTIESLSLTSGYEKERRESQVKWEWMNEESNYSCTDKRYNAWLCMNIQRRLLSWGSMLWVQTIAYPESNIIPSIRPLIANMLQTPPQVNLLSRMRLAPDDKECSGPQDMPLSIADSIATTLPPAQGMWYWNRPSDHQRAFSRHSCRVFTPW